MLSPPPLPVSSDLVRPGQPTEALMQAALHVHGYDCPRWNEWALEISYEDSQCRGPRRRRTYSVLLDDRVYLLIHEINKHLWQPTLELLPASAHLSPVRQAQARVCARRAASDREPGMDATEPADDVVPALAICDWFPFNVAERIQIHYDTTYLILRNDQQSRETVWALVQRDIASTGVLTATADPGGCPCRPCSRWPTHCRWTGKSHSRHYAHPARACAAAIRSTGPG